jgi:biopolymer transport protein ExbD
MFTTRTSPNINAGSMADIAFLMLCFFMVTTIIQEHKGLTILLPQIDNLTAPVNERNVFNIRLNSNNQLMIQHTTRENLAGIRQEIKAFILNKGADENLSENPAKAVISFKADRGSDYKNYIAVLDEIHGAYYELYAERAGITPEAFRKLDIRFPSQNQLYLKGKAGIPMNISIAEL